MLMNVITSFQLVGLLFSYLLITIFIPEFVMGKTLRLKNRYEKFLYYTVISNFYVINLVYLLELLHISYPVTLILFTLVPCFIIKIKLEGIPFRANLVNNWKTFRRLVTGELGLKTYLFNRKPVVRGRFKRVILHLNKVYVKGFAETILVILFIALVFYQYGVNLFESYGYKASDLVVHNWWINALDENDIFVNGVYPYGFHNMLYYLHAVFRFDIYVLLRIESFVQTLWIFLILLCFLKLLCKSKFIPFLGAFFSVGVESFRSISYTRYYSTLPQEYGMIFILPAIYCGFMYFRFQKRELRGLKNNKCKLYLAGFAMSFSLTLTVHFYGTMVAGLFSAAMALGFLFSFLKRPYFKRVMLTFFLSLGIAILPMLIAFMTGTKLQGSLDWGLTVITGRSFGSVSVNNDSDKIYYEDEYVDASGTDANEEDESEEASEELSIKDRITKAPEYIENALNLYIFSDGFLYFSRIFIYLIVLLEIIGLIFLILPRADKFYGSVLVSTSFYIFFMVILLCAGDLGLPPLMNSARASIYLVYSIPVFFTFLTDGTIYFLGLLVFLKNYFYQPLSLAVLLIGVSYTFFSGNFRIPYEMGSMGTNEAMICLTNIIKTEPDYSWTIISANDEGRMVYGHGYHYEIYDFLREMQGAPEYAEVRIPTETVYFFVEKIPVDYGISYEDSGQSISEEGAASFFPRSSWLGIYQGKYRWILMSKMYAWAEAFRALYPNEMKVFYETDNFICYRCEQNPYRVFNFSIDYGFNTAGYSTN